MRKLKCLFVFMIFLCTLTGCSCEHEWQDATCTEAQICLKCEKTEGNPNGHSWVEATCTEPKKCLSCEETEGNPRGHQESDWSYEKTSVKYAEITYVKKCNICGQNSDKKSERIQTESLK